MTLFNLLGQWNGIQVDDDSCVHFSIAEFSLWTGTNGYYYGLQRKRTRAEEDTPQIRQTPGNKTMFPGVI